MRDAEGDEADVRSPRAHERRAHPLRVRPSRGAGAHREAEEHGTPREGGEDAQGVLSRERLLPGLHLRGGRRQDTQHFLPVRALRGDLRPEGPLRPPAARGCRHRQVVHVLGDSQPRHRPRVLGVPDGCPLHREPHGGVVRQPPAQTRPHPLLRPAAHRGFGCAAQHELHDGARLRHHRRSLQVRQAHGHHHEPRPEAHQRRVRRRGLEARVRPHLGALLSHRVQRDEPPRGEEDGDARRHAQTPRSVIYS